MERLPRRVYRHLSTVRGRPVPATAVASGGAILAGIAVVVALAGGGVAAGSNRSGLGGSSGELRAGLGQGAARQLPAGEGAGGSAAGRPWQATPAPAGSAGLPRDRQLRGIILPDLLIVAPAGLTSAQTASLGAIRGLSKVITLDGGQVTAAGRPVNVVGVSPDQLRSWVPLRTASDQAIWSGLAAGGFVASDAAAASLGVRPGGSYQLSGGSAVTVRFVGSARLGIAGIDLLVNQAVSRRLGLVPRVAALISAPGLRMSSLLARVQLILGSGARLVSLRGRQLPVATAQPGQITSYLQLFQASAARYCPALSWTVLAAIGQIESADGQNVGPSSAGALGPMQFLPSTWAAWGIDGFGRTGTPDVMNPLDAVPSAARMLCADGASAGSQAGLRQAIFDYNHATWYVNEVLALAARYAASYR
jgi:Transglycosylase SLT domain